MRAFMMAAGLMLVGCSEEIGPDPTGTSSSSTGSGNVEGLASGSRLRVVTLVGEDGSREQHGFLDTEKNERCSFRIASDGVPRCLPTDIIEVKHYSNPICTQHLGTATEACTSNYAEIVTDACPPRRRVLEVGPPYVDEMFDFDVNGVCVSIGMAPKGTYFLSTDVDPTEWVAASEEVE